MKPNFPHRLLAAAPASLLLLAPAGLLAADGPPANAPARPNVLFIAVDDLRPDLAAFGGGAVKSPHLDQLAAEAVVFNRAYAQFPVCMPSRASVLSGYRPESINYTPRVSGHVPKGTITLPRLFRNHGYETVSIGKVYHANNDDPAGWVRRHTDTFTDQHDGYCSGYQLLSNKNLLANYLTGKHKHGLPASPITEITDTPDENTPDGMVAARAIEELRQFKASGKPFFLATGFYRPHMPLTAPKKYWDLYDRNAIQVPATFTQPWPADCPRLDWDEVRRYGDCPLTGPMPADKAREIIHGYRASVTFMDVQVGKVLDELRKLGLDSNTIIVLWSDNSWRLGEHAMFGKPAPTENPCRIAMMFKAPGFPAKGPSTALTELVDIYPSLAELCHLPLPRHLEGSSVVPLLTDPKRPWKSAAFSSIGRAARAIRTDRYRLIRHATGDLELYDYQNDFDETHNLAKDPAHATTLKSLNTALQAGWRAARPQPAAKTLVR